MGGCSTTRGDAEQQPELEATACGDRLLPVAAERRVDRELRAHSRCEVFDGDLFVVDV